MSNLETVLLLARATGVTLILDGSRIKARGTRDAVDSMMEPLRQHRDELYQRMTTPEPPADPSSWRELAAEYVEHHRVCLTCIAGARAEGLRCGTGAALWRHTKTDV